MINSQLKKSVIWGSLLGGIFIIGTLIWVGPETLIKQIKSVSLFHLFLYIFFSMIVYIFRALRFRLLVGGRGSLAELYGIVCIHTFLVNILPFSSGDLSFPFLLKKYKISESYLDGVPSLVIARLQDLIVTVLFLGISLVWIGQMGTFINPIFFAIGAIIGIALIGGLLLAGRKRVKMLNFSKLQNIPVLKKAAIIVQKAVIAAKGINRNTIIQTSILAIFARITGVIGAYYLINGIGLSMRLPMAFLFCSVYVFLPYLPINAVAGLGVTEVFIGGFFLLVGVQKDVIVPASIQLHALQLFVAVLLGLFGITQMYFLKKMTLQRMT